MVVMNFVLSSCWIIEKHDEGIVRFYHENQDMLAYQQYQAAKNDPEYFMQLALMAYRYYKEGEGKVLH